MSPERMHHIVTLCCKKLLQKMQAKLTSAFLFETPYREVFISFILYREPPSQFKLIAGGALELSTKFLAAIKSFTTLHWASDKFHKWTLGPFQSEELDLFLGRLREVHESCRTIIRLTSLARRHSRNVQSPAYCGIKEQVLHA